MNENEVLVSIWCITYNHEQYIRQALESFLEQETSFRYEVVVHDDASTDGTSDIVKEYETNYPELIHGIYQAENQIGKHGPDRRWLWSLQAEHCRGKYIAFCEGDDYWLDIHKLQIQIDYMEQHSDCVLTVHDAVIVNMEENEIKAKRPYREDKDVSADEIIRQYQGIPPTASMIFRKAALTKDFYTIFLNAGLGDYPLQLWMITRGKIHYFSRIMSVYRYMHKSSWSKGVNGDLKSMVIHYVQMVHLLKEFDTYTQGKYHSSVAKRMESFEKGIFLVCRRRLSLELFEKACGQYDMETKGLYRSAFEDVRESFFRIFHAEPERLFGDIRELYQRYRHIYIMGAGRFGAVIAEQMKYSGLIFEGFVISGKPEEGEFYLEKPVLGLRDIPYALEETGIVIGINLEIWPNAIENLEEAGIRNYLVPAALKGLIEIEPYW